MVAESMAAMDQERARSRMRSDKTSRALRGELLTIVQAADGTGGGQHHGGGHDVSEQGAAPDLIDAGDVGESAGAQIPFMQIETPVLRWGNGHARRRRELRCVL